MNYLRVLVIYIGIVFFLNACSAITSPDAGRSGNLTQEPMSRGLTNIGPKVDEYAEELLLLLGPDVPGEETQRLQACLEILAAGSARAKFLCAVELSRNRPVSGAAQPSDAAALKMQTKTFKHSVHKICY